MGVVTDSAIVNHVGTSLQDYWNSVENLLVEVVSTILSGILFARFPTVERILIIYSFLVTSVTVGSKK